MNLFFYNKDVLGTLNPIKLDDMKASYEKVCMVHTGRYLVCKILRRNSHDDYSIVDLQDDDAEDYAKLFIKFQYKVANLASLQAATIIVIANPAYYIDDKKLSILEVNSPSDIMVIDSTDHEFLKDHGLGTWQEKTSQTVLEICELATESFKNENYNKAIMLYDRAIRYNSNNPIPYQNKASACLRMNFFHMAYEAANVGLQKGGNPAKGLLRKGKAAYGMRQWQEAAKSFAKILEKFPKAPSADPDATMYKDAKEQMEKTTARMNEEKTGEYDFTTLEFPQKPERERDVADYKGPVEIVEIVGKGRGIIASEDIQNGTLLAVSKAFSSGYNQDYKYDDFIGLKLDKKNPSHELQVISTMEALQKNPERTKELYDLYSRDAKEVPEGFVDFLKIVDISHCNRFEKQFIDNGPKDSHLFILPSYLNHSCLGNAKGNIYGDVMVIHASCEIEKGEEICWSYVGTEHGYEKRNTELWKLYGFKCDCELCQTEKNADINDFLNLFQL